MALQGALEAVPEKITSQIKCREASHQPKRLPVDGQLMEILAVAVHTLREFRLVPVVVEPVHPAAILQVFE